MLLLFQDATLSPALLTNFGMAGATIFLAIVFLKHIAAERVLAATERKESREAYQKSLDAIVEHLGAKIENNGSNVARSLDSVAAELKDLREKLPA